MEIKTKYNVGDKVLVEADPILSTTCPFCQGKGELEVNGTVLYCQNCDDGVLESRMINGRQFVSGVITGVHVTIDSSDCGFDEDFAPVESNSDYGICEEYYVEVDRSKYCGDGTYNVRKILPIKE